MDKFDKARIALKKYILANKDKVKKDLAEMRKKSTGKDINWYLSRKNDPLYSCELYKAEGCSHIDGMLCDFPKCSMNKEYIERNTIKANLK